MAATGPPRIDLAGRVALVTGGAGGLGSSCSRVLGAAGATVVVADLPGERLDAALAGLKAAGIAARALEADLSDPAQCADLVPRTVAGAAGLDILVNAVGILQTKPMPEVTPQDWQSIIDVNLTGVFHTTQAAANHMVSHRGGSIISISSVAGRSGRANAPAYAASKAALISLTKSTALAYAPNVRANAVCPGVVMTDMWFGILRDRDREFGPGAGQRYLDGLSAHTPLARLGDPDDIAYSVAFLASDLSAFITGQAVSVDGGLEMS